MTRDALLEAASNADWQQVVQNQGPPCFCFNVDGDGTFCLRAERWVGHSKGKRSDGFHQFVPLADLLEAFAGCPR